MTTLELHGIYHELKFWKNFVKTERFLNGWVAKIKTPELNNEVAEFIKSVPNESVLDVGSGVCSLLNGLVNVDPCDPLGDLYSLVFDYKAHKIKKPLAIPAEELNFVECYDIVHISNALDHSQDPIKALEKLMQATKQGGYLIVQGFVNEALHEGWAGFHQWNIDIDEAGLMHVASKESKTIVAWPPFKFKIMDVNDRKWFYWIIKK